MDFQKLSTFRSMKIRMISAFCFLLNLMREFQKRRWVIVLVQSSIAISGVNKYPMCVWCITREHKLSKKEWWHRVRNQFSKSTGVLNRLLLISGSYVIKLIWRTENGNQNLEEEKIRG